MTNPPNNSRYLSHNKNLSDFLKTIPATRYYGSKKRLLSWIHDSLKGHSYNTVLDAFGGTGSVSLLFQFLGKKVTYNDALTFNAICADVLLNISPDKIDISKTKQFFSNIKPNNRGVISKEYKGIFFTDDENAWLDGVMGEIHKVENVSEKNLYLYLVLQAALMKRPFNLFHRANLNIRTRQGIDRKFGNLTTWNRSFFETIKILLSQLKNRCFIENKANILMPQDAGNINTGYDLVYLDPPYVRQQKKDTYWKKYHFLEGLVNYHRMAEMIEYDLKIKQLKVNEDIDRWETPALFKDNLFSLIRKHRKSIVVLSYMTNAYPSEDELIEFFDQNFNEVKVSYADLSHAMSKGKKTEILIIGVPK